MSDEKNTELNEAEMEKASGGGMSAEQTENRGARDPSARGVIEDPLGPPTGTGGNPGGTGGQVKP